MSKISGRGRTLPIVLNCFLKQGRRANAGREGTTPMLTVVPGAVDADDARRDGDGSSLIDGIVRDGARRMLAEALAAEVDAYIAQFTAERDENGRRLVVRNGSHLPREVLTSAGAVAVTAPRVNDRRVDPDTGERTRVRLGDPARLVPQDPEDHRGAALPLGAINDSHQPSTVTRPVEVEPLTVHRAGAAIHTEGRGGDRPDAGAVAASRRKALLAAVTIDLHADHGQLKSRPGPMRGSQDSVRGSDQRRACARTGPAPRPL
jgi:hypothetical protein